MTSSPARQIGHVGTADSGASWAALFLASGHRVRAFDPGPQSSENTRAYIDRAWAQLEALDAVVDGASLHISALSQARRKLSKVRFHSGKCA